tara:strand:- start:98 stop:430 length:333 start_codon:yes stop_codon:yes gene_type:complete
MKTIKFTKANVLSWENTHGDELLQQATDDLSDVALVVHEVLDKHLIAENSIMGADEWENISHYAGDVHGAHGPTRLYIYTMEDDDWVYVAHFIYEVEYQCFLFRHKKKYK